MESKRYTYGIAVLLFSDVSFVFLSLHFASLCLRVTEKERKKVCSYLCICCFSSPPFRRCFSNGLTKVLLKMFLDLLPRKHATNFGLKKKLP